MRNRANVMAFDIETVPQDRTLEMDAPEEFLVRGARSNFKPETLAAHKARQLEAWPEERVKLGSLDWRRGQVLSYGAGWWEGSVEEPIRRVRVAVVVEEPIEGFAWQDYFEEEPPSDLQVEVVLMACERHLLTDFWRLVALYDRLPQVGFACRDFDAPWLLFRSAVNGVQPSRVWQGSRYAVAGSHVDLIDLCDALSWFGKYSMTGWSLDYYCQWFGVEPQVRGSGEDIHELAQAGDYKAVVEHQLFDVLATMGLYQKVGWVLP